MIILAFFVAWIMASLTFVVGYLLGKGSLTMNTYQNIKKELSHKILPQYRQPSGLVQRPTAEKLNEYRHPEIKEEKEEMRKTMQEGIEPLTKMI